ncbi:hypothetical protein JCM10212_003968 [Sporobolomyces blumeae]
MEPRSFIQPRDGPPRTPFFRRGGASSDDSSSTSELDSDPDDLASPSPYASDSEDSFVSSASSQSTSSEASAIGDPLRRTSTPIPPRFVPSGSHASGSTAPLASPASSVPRSTLKLSFALLAARQALESESWHALATSLKNLSALLDTPSTLSALSPLRGTAFFGAGGEALPIAVFVPTLERLVRDLETALDDGRNPAAGKGREYRRTEMSREDAKAFVALRQRWAVDRKNEDGAGTVKGKGKGKVEMEWALIVKELVKNNPPPRCISEHPVPTAHLLRSVETLLLPCSLSRISLANLDLSDVVVTEWAALRHLAEVVEWYLSFALPKSAESVEPVLGREGPSSSEQAGPDAVAKRAKSILDGVKSLDLSKNRLSTLPPYVTSLFPNLETLSLSYNNFSQFPPHLVDFRNLRRLRTKGNPAKRAQRRPPSKGTEVTARTTGNKERRRGKGNKPASLRPVPSSEVVPYVVQRISARRFDVVSSRSKPCRSLLSISAEIVYNDPTLLDSVARPFDRNRAAKLPSDEASTASSLSSSSSSSSSRSASPARSAASCSSGTCSDSVSGISTSRVDAPGHSLPPHLLDLILRSYPCASCDRFVLAPLSDSAHSAVVSDAGTSEHSDFVPAFREQVYHFDPGISVPIASRAPTVGERRPATTDQLIRLAVLSRVGSLAPQTSARAPSFGVRPLSGKGDGRRTTSGLTKLVVGGQNAQEFVLVDMESSLADERNRQDVGGETEVPHERSVSGFEGRGWRFCLSCTAAHLSISPTLKISGGTVRDGEVSTCRCCICQEERRVRGEGPVGREDLERNPQVRADESARESAIRMRMVRWVRRKGRT